MSSQVIVMKFGGTSLEDGPAFQRVANIVNSKVGANLVVVASAMSGVTDALISILQRAAQGETSQALQTLEHHLERHLAVASSLGATESERMRVNIEESRTEIAKLFDDVCARREITAESQDAIASQGERLCANLLTIVLERYGIPAAYVDARRCVITNAAHGSASPLIREVSRRTRAELKPLLEMKRVPVLGGFIGATLDGVTTTLGRGTSDYSATLIGAALGAREIQIWTDVNGVHTADPALVKSARTVCRISYEEAAQLAWLGARVIHSKMFEPVLEQEIPIQIRNSCAPEQRGTLIRASSEPAPGGIKAIAHRTNLTRIDITSTPEFVANGFLHAIRKVLKQHQTRMDIIGLSRVGITCGCDEVEILPSLVQDLERVGSVEIKKQCAIVGCVGDGLQIHAGSGTTISGVLRDIDPSLNWQSISNCSLVAIVDRECVGEIVSRLHQGVFECDWARQQAQPNEAWR